MCVCVMINPSPLCMLLNANNFIITEEECVWITQCVCDHHTQSQAREQNLKLRKNFRKHYTQYV